MSTEQFLGLKTQDTPSVSTSSPEISTDKRSRGESSSSTFAGRLRSASKKFESSSPPVGMWDATASIASKAPSLADIRRGSFGSDGWSEEGQLKERRRRSSQAGDEPPQSPNDNIPRNPHSPTSRPHQEGLPEVLYEHTNMSSAIDGLPARVDKVGDSQNLAKSGTGTESTPAKYAEKSSEAYRTTPFDNGYHFPPQHTWVEATVIGSKAFWKYATTPLGFLVTIYGLNIVAWGGMIFLLLCNAAPQMCHPTCDDINSPRRVWIEIDSQVLTALFCVTGFGLIPWRFRDLYYLLRWRLMKDPMGLRRLAGIHRDWFRLEGSQNLPVTLGPEEIESQYEDYPEMSLPYPLKSVPDAPLTGIRAPPTATWRLDYVIWMFVWNTFLQAVLSGLMWGLNRYDRPSWSTGVFVALACIVAALAGIEIFVQGRKVKAVEGVSVSEKDLQRLERDKEMGRSNINTISGKAPKKKKSKGKSKLFGKESTDS